MKNMMNISTMAVMGSLLIGSAAVVNFHQIDRGFSMASQASSDWPKDWNPDTILLTSGTSDESNGAQSETGNETAEEASISDEGSLVTETIEIIQQEIYDEDGNVIETIFLGPDGEIIDPSLFNKPDTTEPEATDTSESALTPSEEPTEEPIAEETPAEEVSEEEPPKTTEPIAYEAALSGTYEGSHFSVGIPSGFSTIASLKSPSGDGHDSVLFVSPDQSLTFYVYAPKMGGTAEDIILNPEVEFVSGETASDDTSAYINTWWTIEANDQSYSRSYHSRLDIEADRLTIFGAKYATSEAFKAALPLYRVFKSSIELKE